MKIDSKLYISMNVYTRSENGLLLYMENEVNDFLYGYSITLNV